MKHSEKMYLTETQVSEMTGIAKQTLRNWRTLRRGIKYIKCGRCVRYSYSDVLNYMESHKIDTDH